MAARQPLPNLTTVRFFAALYVICYHFVPWTHATMGYTGVNLFFVLSGFILAYNYPEVKNRTRFYVARLARVYPLYAFSLLLGLPHFVMVAYQQHNTKDLVLAPLLSFLLLQTWVPFYAHSINSAAWTLPAEAFFYLTFPFLIPWVGRKIARWKTWVAIIAVVVLLPATVTYTILGRHFPNHLPAMLDALTVPLFHLGEFIIGLFFGLRFLQHRPSFRAWHVAAATVLLIVSSYAASFVPSAIFVVDGLLAVPYGILLYALAGWQSRWFGHPILQLGGEISYGIYLLQFSVFTKVQRLFPGQQPSVAVLLPLTFLAAYLGYIWIEKPARTLILKAFGYHPSQKPIPTPGLHV